VRATVATTILFALAAVLVTALLAFVAYRGVRNALGEEFGRRLQTLAGTAASQVGADDVRDVHRLGEEAGGYLALQVLLEEIRASTGLAAAAALDSAGLVLYDTRGAEHYGETSPLETLAPGALGAALAGRATVTPVFRAGGVEHRAGLAPIRGEAGVAGVIAIESAVDYLPVLAGFRRTMLLATLLAALGIAVLAAGVVRALSSAARLERRLSRAENLAAMGRLTATMAHEIKNPLAIIRGSAQRLGRLDPESQRWADSVVEETDRLSRTVHRYLQFARGDESAGERGDAVAALESTLALLEGEMRARRVTLERERGTPAATVALDSESLKQVYLNLILNALEAMPEGGTLAVSDGERGAYELRIRDTGPGVPPDVLERLGSPFFTTRPQGTGLGLFLARRLVESAGGRLTITSEVGKGTSCLVRLPRHGSSERKE
jgi:signal transduction histidine kinase